MQFRGGMNELMRQAARMQRKIDQAKTELKDKELTVEGLGGKVKVTLSLGRSVKRIEVDPETLKTEDRDLVFDDEDLRTNFSHRPRFAAGNDLAAPAHHCT